MAIKNFNVGGEVYPIAAGGGNAVNASLFYFSGDYDNDICESDRLYLRCAAGTIEASDTVEFARLISGQAKRKGGRNTLIYRYSYKGWIKPRKWLLDQSDMLTISLVFVRNDGDTDIWEVRPDFKGEDTWPMIAEAFSDTKGFPHLDRHCGIAVFRDGQQITDWLHFNVEKGERGYFLGRW